MYPWLLARPPTMCLFRCNTSRRTVIVGASGAGLCVRPRWRCVEITIRELGLLQLHVHHTRAATARTSIPAHSRRLGRHRSVVVIRARIVRAAPCLSRTAAVSAVRRVGRRRMLLDSNARQ